MSHPSHCNMFSFSKVITKFHQFLNDISERCNGLKMLLISYSVPNCSLSIGPISLSRLLTSNISSLIWIFIFPACGFTFFYTCFKKHVLWWSTSNTLNVFLSLTGGTSSAENLRNLGLEFLDLEQLHESTEKSFSLYLRL